MSDIRSDIIYRIALKRFNESQLRNIKAEPNTVSALCTVASLMSDVTPADELRFSLELAARGES